MYVGLVSHVAQGDTECTAIQKSGFPRMRSKYPVRSRTWSLPTRRLKEELNGCQDLSQQRSPVMHREDRTSPSSRTSFTEEAIGPQRCDYTFYSASCVNDMRDVDGVQEYGNPRSHSTRGSAPDRERDDGVGYFDRPKHLVDYLSFKVAKEGSLAREKSEM